MGQKIANQTEPLGMSGATIVYAPHLTAQGKWQAQCGALESLFDSSEYEAAAYNVVANMRQAGRIDFVDWDDDDFDVLEHAAEILPVMSREDLASLLGDPHAHPLALSTPCKCGAVELTFAGRLCHCARCDQSDVARSARGRGGSGTQPPQPSRYGEPVYTPAIHDQTRHAVKACQVAAETLMSRVAQTVPSAEWIEQDDDAGEPRRWLSTGDSPLLILDSASMDDLGGQCDISGGYTLYADAVTDYYTTADYFTTAEEILTAAVQSLDATSQT